ncbi:Fur family transcriptional regulator [Novosphingobium sp. BL-52-GroH]|uniref:Fur family transcriptional regulator n=1 Tax=Novosphingobium sp. BL-52-GroH TaxID=3349877 RepID=UPI00384A5FA6
MTPPRRLVARVLQESLDHPDVVEIYRRAQAIDPRISTATVYRSVKLFEDLKLVIRHRFGDGPARYELAPPHPHDHLIDVETGQVIEFRDPRIDAIQSRLARELGYDIVSYKLEIFATPARRRVGRRQISR